MSLSTLRIVDKETILADRRARGVTIAHGTLQEPIARLITSPQGLNTLAHKVTLDVNQGRADIPTLYEPIYDRLFADDLPASVDTNIVANAQAVFLRRLEGGETYFGTLAADSGSSVPIVGYSTGFEWTREHKKWNQTYAIELYNKALGRAYNALLNDIHLRPFVTFVAPPANLTAADTTGATFLDKTRNTLVNAIRAAGVAKRPGTVLLASTADKYNIEDAVARRVDAQGNALPAVSDISTIIYYDGEQLAVGEKTYSYVGVTPKTAYLIRPKQQFMELCATEGGQDMIVEFGNPDVSRGVLEQMIAHTYRGVFAAVAGNTQQIALP